MPRDRRFVAVHRGGPLDKTSHRLLASWAADCAGHALHLFTAIHPDDDRPLHAIESARLWARGEITVGEARDASVQAHAAAREATDDAARAVARAAGHAVATAHMADHALGTVYVLRAVKLAAAKEDAAAAVERERQWQMEHLPDQVRELVLSALAEKSVLGNWEP